MRPLKPKAGEFWYIRLKSHSMHLISVKILEVTAKTVLYTTDYEKEFSPQIKNRYELSEVKFIEKFNYVKKGN